MLGLHPAPHLPPSPLQLAKQAVLLDPLSSRARPVTNCWTVKYRTGQAGEVMQESEVKDRTGQISEVMQEIEAQDRTAQERR